MQPLTIIRGALFGALTLGAPALHAGIAPECNVGVLLVVDVSDPAHVTISATDRFPAHAGHPYSMMYEGVLLHGVLQPGALETGLLGPDEPVAFSTLHPTLTMESHYDRAERYTPELPTNDLRLFAFDSLGMQAFATETAAFTGEMHLDVPIDSFVGAGELGLISLAPALPLRSFEPLGSWITIPTPGALAIVPLAVLAHRRRR